MARSLVSNSCKHCEVYVVDGARESNGIHITSTDADYVPEEGEDSANDDGLLEVEVDAESEPSTEEEVFDDSADDGDHDDQFGFDVEDNDPPSNAFRGFTGPLNDERTVAAGTAEGDKGLREGDEQVGGLSDGYETDDIDSYEGDSDDMIKKRRFPKYNEAEMNRDWISKKIANNISRGEEMKLATVIQTIQDKYMANISVGKTYWARRKAREEVHGRAIQQYGKLRDYCTEILRANPGSSLTILVDRPSLTHQPRFMRMYMCLDAVKKGFLAGCRPIIGVDGCHLKGDHG
ncbi:hypothetical protein AHAS_Ahas02G0138800 [Arachis hypogaea]